MNFIVLALRYKSLIDPLLVNFCIWCEVEVWLYAAFYNCYKNYSFNSGLPWNVLLEVGWSRFCWTLNPSDSVIFFFSYCTTLSDVLGTLVHGIFTQGWKLIKVTVDLLCSNSLRSLLGHNSIDQSKSLNHVELKCNPACCPEGERKESKWCTMTIRECNWTCDCNIFEVFVPRYTILKHSHLRRL